MRIERKTWAGLALVWVVGSLLGCQSPTAGLDDYKAGHYQLALDKAQAQARQSSGTSQQRANYVAGLSAYRLGRSDLALNLLNPLTGHKDPSLAGPSNATVGLIYAQQDEYDMALPRLLKATEQLTGEDKAQALYHLGIVEQKVGQWTTARSHLSQAIVSSRDSDLQRSARQRMSMTSFTLQFGAYKDRPIAEKRAADMALSALTAGAGKPRVVLSSEDGKRMYLVQAGFFGNFKAADTIKDRLARINDAIVVPTNGGR